MDGTTLSQSWGRVAVADLLLLLYWTMLWRRDLYLRHATHIICPGQAAADCILQVIVVVMVIVAVVVVVVVVGGLRLLHQQQQRQQQQKCVQWAH